MAFTQEDIDDLISRYHIAPNDRDLVPTPDELILAIDNSEDWSGNYGELFVKNGKLYETGCSHCSCYGCEDQWSPDETFLKVLAHRPDGFMGTPMKEVERLAREAGYKGE